MPQRPPTVDELEAEWLSGEDCTMADALMGPFADPEAVWEAILRILRHELSEDQIALLAAGPVEDLLVLYGVAFIERIEAEAKRDPAFAHLLGGVWQRDMPPELWQRIDAARGGKTW